MELVDEYTPLLTGEEKLEEVSCNEVSRNAKMLFRFWLAIVTDQLCCSRRILIIGEIEPAFQLRPTVDVHIRPGIFYKIIGR
jgi:hypothetical protein